MILPLGKVAVVTPGTPVPLVTSVASLPGSNYKVHAVLVQALHSNVGKVFIGTATLTKSTFVGVLGQLAVPTANSIPAWSASLTLAPGGISLQDLRLDADNAGEGAIVSVLVT